LEDSAESYGIKATKDTTVSEMIKGGICPKDIPIEMLLGYCKQDVYLTNLLFEKQFSHFIRLPKNLQNLILERMDYRINTHLMSMNGMYMDRIEMTTQIEDLKAGAAAYEDLLIAGMASRLTEMSVLEINPSSTKQLEIVLYGGTYTVKRDVPTGEVYKTGPKAGSPKTKKQDMTYNVLSPIYPMFPTGYTTKEEDLKKLPSSAFVGALLTYRGIMKELNTYFIGYMTAGREEGRYNVINTEFKHTITPTGRISSTKPNIQNLTGD
jgi:DNA polymerase I-like protein with 3'-5' exonuclease and polymerase domains